MSENGDELREIVKWVWDNGPHLLHLATLDAVAFRHLAALVDGRIVETPVRCPGGTEFNVPRVYVSGG